MRQLAEKEGCGDLRPPNVVWRFERRAANGYLMQKVIMVKVAVYPLPYRTD